MSTLHNIFLDIAQILDNRSNLISLQNKLCNPDYDFDSLVKIGSHQLVLPTIYCKLREKKLLDHLPSELKEYLKELTAINRNRNKTILSEIKLISALFQKEGITHSFLKGSALLVAGYYKDLGERMIGDIDILVENSQLELAHNLLSKQDYDPVHVTFGHDYFEHKHLPRLIPKERLSAVEIHRKLIDKQVKNEINPNDYLQNSNTFNTVSIGSINHIFWHAALNFEINDFGHFYNYLSLRSAYDLLIIKDELNTKDYEILASIKHINQMLNKMSLYFDSIDTRHNSIFSKFRLKSYKTKQQYKLYKKFCFNVQKAIFIIQILSNRTFYFITNSSYRKNCIADYKRITTILKNQLDPYKN